MTKREKKQTGTARFSTAVDVQKTIYSFEQEAYTAK